MGSDSGYVINSVWLGRSWIHKMTLILGIIQIRIRALIDNHEQVAVTGKLGKTR